MKEVSFSRTVKEVHFGAWVLDPKRQTISDGDLERELEPLLFKILCYLILNNEEIITRQDLVDDVWCQKYVDDNAINRAMSELRKVLKSDSQRGVVVKTHYRKGYSFFLDVNVIYIDEQQQSINKLTPKPKVISEPVKVSKKKPFLALTFLLVLTSVYVVSQSLMDKIGDDTATQIVQFKESMLSWAPGQYDFVKISPNKTLITFSFLPNNSDMETMVVKNVQSGAEKKLSIDGSKLFPVGWSADSAQIFYRVEFEERCEVWRIDADFENNNHHLFDCGTKIKHGSGLGNDQFVYSKLDYRGRDRLAAVTNRNLVTGEEFQITSPNLNSFGDNFLLFEKSLGAIFFERHRYDSVELYMTNPDGSELIKLFSSEFRIDSLQYDEKTHSLLWYNNRVNELMEYSLEKKKLSKVIQLPIDEIIYASYHPISTSRLIATSYPYAQDIYNLDLDTMSLDSLINKPSIEYGAVASKEYVYFLTVLGSGEVIRRMNISSGEVRDVQLPITDYRALKYNEVTDTLLIRYQDKIELYDGDFMLLDTIKVEGSLISASFSQSGNVAYVTVDKNQVDNKAFLYSREFKMTSLLPVSNAVKVRYINDEELAFLSSDDTLQYFDINLGQVTTLIELPEKNRDHLLTVVNDTIVYSCGEVIFSINKEEKVLSEIFRMNGMVISDINYSPSLEKLVLSTISTENNKLLVLEGNLQPVL